MLSENREIKDLWEHSQRVVLNFLGALDMKHWALALFLLLDRVTRSRHVKEESVGSVALRLATLLYSCVVAYISYQDAPQDRIVRSGQSE